MNSLMCAHVRSFPGNVGAYLFCALMRDGVPNIVVLFSVAQTEEFVGRFRDCLNEENVTTILLAAKDPDGGLPAESRERAIVIAGYAAGGIWAARHDLVRTHGVNFSPPAEWYQLSPRVTTMQLLSSLAIADPRRRHWAPDVVVGLFCEDRQFRAWVCYDARSIHAILSEHSSAVGMHLPKYRADIALTALPDFDPLRHSIEIGAGPASALFAESLACWCEWRSTRLSRVVASVAVPGATKIEDDCC